MTSRVVLIIDNASDQESKASGRRYVSFWLRLKFDDCWISVAGWKYYPDKRTISTPSRSKGPQKGFVDLARMNPEFYNRVLTKAVMTFEDEMPVGVVKGEREEGEDDVEA